MQEGRCSKPLIDKVIPDDVLALVLWECRSEDLTKVDEAIWNLIRIFNQGGDEIG
jgi:hypothetical protein